MDSPTRGSQEEPILNIESSVDKENYNTMIGKEKPARIWDRIDVETKKHVLGAKDSNHHLNMQRMSCEMTNESEKVCLNLKREVQALVKENSEKEVKVRDLKTLLGRKKFSNERKLKKLEDEWKSRLEEQSLQFEKVRSFVMLFYLILLDQFIKS